MSSGIYAYWDNVRHYYVYVGKDNNINKKSNMFSYNSGNKPRKVFRLKYNCKEIPIGGFIDFTTPEIIHDLICEAVEDYNE